MNITMIVAIILFWVSAFNFGMVLERIRQEKRGKKVVLHMKLSKEEVEKMVDDAVAEVKTMCMHRQDVERMIKCMQIDVADMGDELPLDQRKQVISLLGKYIDEVRNIPERGKNDKDSM